MATAEVTAEIDDRGLATILLCAPERRNAIGLQWLADLEAAVERVAEATPRAILIVAEGSVFTAGGDLRHLGGRLDDLDAALAEMVRPYHKALVRLADGAAPIVCGIQGVIAGGGLGIAWVADIVLASDRARFVPGFPHLGLSGDGGSSWWLPRLIGLRRAQQLMILGRELSADDALEWGLVSEIVPAEHLRERAEETAVELASRPTAAIGQVRRLLAHSLTRTFAQQLDAEADAMISGGLTHDAGEGVRAMLERRAPNFIGR